MWQMMRLLVKYKPEPEQMVSLLAALVVERHTATMASLFARIMAVAAIGLLGPLVAAAPASAHGGDETTEGYLLVQQALGHLAHDTTMSGVELAMEKVDDALATGNQKGVNVAELKQGKAALKVGDVAKARTLLQGSIRDALASLAPATGNETGTRQVEPGLSGRSGLRAQDWALLAGSVAVLLLGVWLAFRFRPHDTIRTLRAHLSPAVTDSSDDPPKEV